MYARPFVQLFHSHANAGIELSIGEVLSFIGTPGSLQPDIASFTPTELSDGAYGTVYMEA